MVDIRHRIVRWTALVASVCVAAALISPVAAKSPTRSRPLRPPATKDSDTPTADPERRRKRRRYTPEPPPPDGKKYDLRYKLSTGDVLRYTVTHHAAIRSTIDQSTQAAETKTDSVKVWKVTDVLPNHQIEFMNVVEQVHMVNQLPDRAPTEYDSAKDKTPPPGYEDTATAVGVPLSVVRMTPARRSGHPQQSNTIRAARRNRTRKSPCGCPTDRSLSDATWDEPYDINVQLQSGISKSMQTRRHYKLTDVSNNVASIEVSYQILSPIDAEIESKLVGRFMKGTVRFDIGKGRILSQEYEIDKRVLGFAGATSSMHYLMQMKEELADSPAKASNQPKPNQSPTATARAARRQQGDIHPLDSRPIVCRCLRRNLDYGKDGQANSLNLRLRGRTPHRAHRWPYRRRPGRPSGVNRRRSRSGPPSLRSRRGMPRHRCT